MDIIWKEISNLSVKNDKVIDGYSKIDAYVVNNDEVKAYVEVREANFRKAKAFLENKDMKSTEAFLEVKMAKQLSTERKVPKIGTSCVT